MSSPCSDRTHHGPIIFDFNTDRETRSTGAQSSSVYVVVDMETCDSKLQDIPGNRCIVSFGEFEISPGTFDN